MIARKFRVPPAVFGKKPEERILTDYFQVRVFPNSSGYNRFGFIISSKAEKKSVRRHFWKRTILDASAKQPNFGKDFVIIANSKLAGAKKEDALADLEKVFSEIK